jgi:hypothetical protein
MSDDREILYKQNNSVLGQTAEFIVEDDLEYFDQLPINLRELLRYAIVDFSASEAAEIYNDFGITICTDNIRDCEKDECTANSFSEHTIRPLRKSSGPGKGRRPTGYYRNIR